MASYVNSLRLVRKIVRILHILASKAGIPKIAFLNTILLDLENHNAGAIATAIFAGLALYLLWATTKGAIKFGVRIPFICKMHIME